MKPNWKTLFLLTTCCTLGLMTSVRAQVSPDGTLSTTVNSPDNLNFTINNGNRVGGNLFHSFREFSVPNGGSAVFQNPLDVQNIINRVTGGSLSEINGLIQSQGSANLFLLNPAGIFFGPNARLNIGGSFFATTADSLLFDNGLEFSATNPQAPPLLTVNIPIGLRFRDNPGNITNQSPLSPQVPPGQTFALIGGDVNFDSGSLTALGVNVEIGGLKAPGTVGINNNGSLSFPNGVTRGDISFRNGASVINAGGGGIAVNGRNVEVSGGSSLIAGIFPAFGMSEAQAGDIVINATDKLTITGTANSSSAIDNLVGSQGVGNAGNIIINTGSLEGRGNFLIASSTLGQGNAGRVTITARDNVSLEGLQGFGSGVGSFVGSSARGNGGDIVINARSLSLSNFAQVSTSTLGQGRAGNIQVNGLESISVNSNSNIQANSFIDGQNAGNIDLRATGGSIVLNQGSIGTSAQNGGFAGGITLNARDQISITNNSFILSEGSFGRILIGQSSINDASPVTPNSINIDNSILSTRSGANAQVNPGTVSIRARESVSFTGSTILANVDPGVFGNGSDVDISAGSVFLDNARLQTSNAGQGNAGNITVQAKDTISLKGSLIFSDVGNRQGAPAKGNVGNILLDGRVVSLTDGSQLQAGVFANAQGNPGTVSIRARESVSFTGSEIFANVDPGGFGNGSDVDISAGSVFLDNAQLVTSNAGQGNAGNITVQAKDTISIANTSLILSNVGSRQGAPATGNVGNILLDGRVVSLTDTSQLQAGFFGNAQGNPGSVSIRARESVSFTGQNSGIFANVDPGGLGNSSDVEISAESFSLNDGAVLITDNSGRGNGGDIKITAKNLSLNNSAQINASTSGQGNAGNISVRVGDAIALANSSFINSVVGRGGEGIGGDIDIRARSLTLTGGSQISTFVFREGNGLSGGIGRAGNIDINATDFVNIFGVATAGFSSGLFASAQRGTTAISPQAAGNINLTTGDFRIADGAVVNALTYNSGNAGNITINANTFTANGGGQLITTTRSSGNAGNINLNVRDRITISASDPNYNQRVEQARQFGPPEDIVNNQGAASGIFANTASGSTGKGGNITIQPLQNSFPRIAIADGGEVRVDSQGQGVGGEISIRGNSLTLDRGIISASTQSADGGNINLSLRNFLRLRNESLISANARGQQSGNGGNITIDTPFIVAFPQNNDITANAVSGDGGQVTINRSAILFGIAPLRRADLQRLLPDNNLDPRRLPTSDITAFSEQSSNFGDNVLVTSPDVDPSRGLVELPETVTDPTQKIAQNPCQQGVGNEFFVTGRGGLPTTPNQTLSSDNVRVDLLQPVASSGNSRAAIKPATNPTATRLPAQGWIFNDKGQVVLTAYDPTNTGSQRSFSTAAACPAR